MTFPWRDSPIVTSKEVFESPLNPKIAYPKLMATLEGVAMITEDQAALVIKAMLLICPQCWERPLSECTCMKDE